MKKLSFFMVIIFAALLSAEGKVDFFKIKDESKSYDLYFHTDKDPQLITGGKNFTVLFNNTFFVKEVVSASVPSGKFFRQIKIKNYPAKGGALNIFASKNVRGTIKRISPDVVKVVIHKNRSFAPAIVKNHKKSNKKLTRNKADVKFAAASEILKTPAAQKTVEKKAKNKVKKIVNDTKESEEFVSLFDDKDDEKEKKDGVILKSDSDGSNFTMLAALFLVISGAAIFAMKKKGKKSIFGNSGILNIVETLNLGLKEKLLLIDVAGNYILLFVKDKDVKQLAEFKGEDGCSIKNMLRESEQAISNEWLSKDLAKDEDLMYEKPVVSQSSEQSNKKEKKSIKPFHNKLEQLIEKEQSSRKRGVEQDIFETINRLRKVSVR